MLDNMDESVLPPSGKASENGFQETSLANLVAGEVLLNQTAFDVAVSSLESAIKNTTVNRVMLLLRQLIGAGYIVNGIFSANQLEFQYYSPEETGEEAVGIVSIPFGWYRAFESHRLDHFEQLGAVVFAASQARDFFNGKMDASIQSQRACAERSRACEAEFFLTLLAIMPDLMLSSYQMEICSRFPLGWSSLPEELRYEPIAFVPDAPHHSRSKRSERLSRSLALIEHSDIIATRLKATSPRGSSQSSSIRRPVAPIVTPKTMVPEIHA